MKESEQGKVDLALVQAMLDGEPTAKDGFLQRMRCIGRILWALNRRLGIPLPPDELQDLAQETFAILWNKIETYRGQASLETWSYHFCRRTLMNWVRRKQKDLPSLLRPERLPDSGRPEAVSVDQRLVQDALEQLEPDEVEVIELKHYESLSFEEIGRRLHVSPNSAKTRYYRGREKLRRILRPHFAEDIA